MAAIRGNAWHRNSRQGDAGDGHGELFVAAVEATQQAELDARGWKTDYLTVRRRTDLLPPTADDLAAKTPLVALAASRLGQTRLIDNLEIDL